MTIVRPTERREIEDVVRRLTVRRRVRESGGPHAVCDCVFCGKPGHLYVNEDTGLADCKVCGWTGSIFGIATAIGFRVRTGFSASRGGVTLPALGGERRRPRRVAPTVAVEDRSKRVRTAEDEDGALVRAYLSERGIGDDAIAHFRLGVAYLRPEKDETPEDRAIGVGRVFRERDGKRVELGVGIPYLDGDRCVLIKMRNLARGKDGRRFSRTTGGHSALFHGDDVSGEASVVLVEGEMDAISVWQAGVRAVASTSLGANAKIPEEWRLALADATDIVLWYDDDDAGRDAIAALVAAYGADRCRIACLSEDVRDRVLERTGRAPKDANDLLVAFGKEGRGEAYAIISDVIQKAVPVALDGIVSASTLVQGVRERLASSVGDEYLGVPTPWTKLNEMIRGLRAGELTVVTGHPGQGKSTFVDDWSFSLAEAGHPVLKCSFENGPSSIAESLLMRYLAMPLSELLAVDPGSVDAVAHDIERRAVYVLDHEGEVELDALVSALRYARRRLQVRHAFVDHIGYVKRPREIDRFEWPVHVLRALNETSRALDMAIVVVNHQNRDALPHQIPSGRSLAGGADGEREAWTGITVWRPIDAFGAATKDALPVKAPDGRKLELRLNRDQSVIYVWKARHKESREGMTILDYDTSTARFYDLGGRPDDRGSRGVQEPMFGDVDGILPE